MKTNSLRVCFFISLLLACTAFAAADGLTLPADTQVIGDEAFCRCESLTGVLVIPDSVRTIGDYSFAGCTGLTGVPVIPESVESIGAHAFDGCTGLSGLIYLRPGLNVDETAFDGCTGLTVTNAEYRVAVVGDSPDSAAGTLDNDALRAVSAWCNDNSLPCAYYYRDIQAPVREGCNVIITVGARQAAKVPAAAEDNPDVYYICLDAEVQNPGNNVFASLYRVDEAGFMAGYAAVYMGYRSLGFMGGMESGESADYGQGFLRGADRAAAELSVSDEVTVAYTYTGTFSRSDTVYEVAESWYDSGVEVIFSCGGDIFYSIVEAAEHNDLYKYVIGADTDRSASAAVVTGAMKFVGVTAVDALSHIVGGTWSEIGGTNPRLGVVSQDPDLCHVGVPEKYSGRFTSAQRDMAALSLYSHIASVSGSVKINVTSSPVTPQIAWIETCRDGSVELAWTGIAGAADYTLYYAPASEGITSDSSRISGLVDSQISIDGLEFKTEYCFAMSASVFGTEIMMSPPVHVITRGINYRALLIGEVHFHSENGASETCKRNAGDCNRMYSMLTSRYTPAGTHYMTPAKYTDQSASGVLSLISSTFADADADDVSLFFIATHGDSTTTYEEWEEGCGSLCCIGEEGEDDWLLLSDLSDALQDVPGEVIVIIESCGSGAAVYDPEHPEQQNSAGRILTADTIANAFPAAALEREDRIMYIFDAEGNAQIIQGRIGELRVPNKFYVLCASRYLQDSWGTEGWNADTAYNYFTMWLTQGVGTLGSMPADSDENGTLTLNELFSYISSVGDSCEFNGEGDTQQVQVYPSGSSYELFRAEPMY